MDDDLPDFTPQPWSRKKRFIVFSILLLIIIGGLAMVSGHFVKPLLELAIRSSGFPKANIESVSVIPNGLLIEAVNLDPDGFSTVEAAQITGSWTDIILHKRVSALTLKNVELSGELDDQGQFVIAGWDASLNSPSSTPGMLLENINIDGLTIDFETPQGAIRVEGKLSLQSAADGTRNFQASAWGKQKQLSLNVSANGKILSDGEWHADVELLEGRLDMGAIKGSRANGKVALQKKVDSSLTYSGQIAAGGIRINDIPFQDFNVTFDSAKLEILQFHTSPTGYDGIELAGRIFSEPALTLELSGTIKDIDQMSALLDRPKDDFVWLSEADPLAFKVMTPVQTLSAPKVEMNWSLTAGSVNQTFSGTAVYESETQKLDGTLKPVTLSGATLTSLLPLKTNYEVDVTGGTLDAGGTFSTNVAEKPLKISGLLTVKGSGLSGTWKEYPFTNLNGAAKLTQLLPWQMDKDQSITVDTVGTGVNLTNGKMTFGGSQTGGFSVAAASFDVAGGKVSAAPFTWKTDAKENPVTVNIENINLATLAQTTDTDGFIADGTLNGTIPLVFTPQGLMFKTGKITTTTPGQFKYTPKAYPAALQGEDTRMQTVRTALSDFRYTSFEVEVDGPLNGDMKATLKATGKNPAFADRPINLNINLEGALAPVVQEALQPGRIADSIQKSVTGERP